MINDNLICEAVARGGSGVPIGGVSIAKPDAFGDGQESSPLAPLGPQVIAAKVYIIFVIGSQIGEPWPRQSATPPADRARSSTLEDKETPTR